MCYRIPGAQDMNNQQLARQKVKKYLNKVNKTRTAYRSELARYKELSHVTTPARSTAPDYIKRPAPANPTEITAIKLDEQYKKMARAFKRYTDARCKIEIEILNIKDIQLSLILYMKYISCMNWKAISKATDKSEPQLYNLHNKALDLFINYLLTHRDA